MGTLSKEFEGPAYWDGQRERRIFLGQDSEGGCWRICWMRGYSGVNKVNRFAFWAYSDERDFAETRIRLMAKEKGWMEMKRCPKCGLLHHSGKAICYSCESRPGGRA
jgi:hypothetical protein